MDWTFTDTGLNGACPIKVTYEKIPHNLEAHLFNRDGAMVYTFGKTVGSNGYKALCSDLIDSKLSLYSKSTSWSSPSVEVASLNLSGVNGHDIDVTISAAILLIQ